MKKRLRFSHQEATVVNITNNGSTVFVTIRFPHGDEIFLGRMNDVMLNEEE
jgi:hypothetical protein